VLLEFVRVVEAEQVVAGTLHHLTLEAIEAGRKKVCEAKVWVKPWLDFKELQEFDQRPSPTPTSAPAKVHAPAHVTLLLLAIFVCFLLSLTASRVQGLGPGCYKCLCLTSDRWTCFPLKSKYEGMPNSQYASSGWSDLFQLNSKLLLF